MGAKALRELRYLSGTTQNTAFTAADNAAWAAGTATKLRIQNLDDTGLVYENAEDMSHVESIVDGYTNIPTLRVGTLGFSTFLGAAEADTSANPVATLVSKIVGGLSTPTARTYTLDSSGVHTTVKIYASGIDAEDTGHVLVKVGAKGDGRGNGEVRCATGSGLDYLDLHMALSGAPSDGDSVTIATTAYIDASQAQQYLDFLWIGVSTNMQRQAIGAQCTALSLAGGAPGELPSLNYTWSPIDWQWVASGDLDAMDASVTASGNNPPADRGLMGFFLQDNGVTTRTAFKGGGFSMDGLINYAIQPGLNGLNGMHGFEKLPIKPTGSFTLLHDEDMPGLYTDYHNSTAKTLTVQFGATDQRAAAIHIPKCYLSADPKTSELNGLDAVDISIYAIGDSNVTDSSPYIIGWF